MNNRNSKFILITYLVLLLFVFVSFHSNESIAAVPIDGLFNTGVDNSGVVLPVGSSEQHYSLTGPSSSAFVLSTYATWVTPPSNSAWIGPAGNMIGTYIYGLTFDLTGLDPINAMITGDWATDNSAVIFLNGNDTSITKPFTGFDSLSSFTIDNYFSSGINTLEFRVTQGSSSGSNPTGLLVANLQGQAPIVPEPISSTLFIIGGATLGLRRFRKRK